MSGRLGWPAVIAASALSLDLLLVGSVQGPLRLLVTLWFVLVCTGMSFAPLLEAPTVAIQLLLAVVLSIILDTLAATAIVEVGGLSAPSWLIVLESLCLVGFGLQMRLSRRRRRSCR